MTKFGSVPITEMISFSIKGQKRFVKLSTIITKICKSTKNYCNNSTRFRQNADEKSPENCKIIRRRNVKYQYTAKLSKKQCHIRSWLKSPSSSNEINYVLYRVFRIISPLSQTKPKELQNSKELIFKLILI